MLRKKKDSKWDEICEKCIQKFLWSGNVTFVVFKQKKDESTPILFTN